jgi:hypothetical protein
VGAKIFFAQNLIISVLLVVLITNTNRLLILQSLEDASKISEISILALFALFSSQHFVAFLPTYEN